MFTKMVRATCTPLLTLVASITLLSAHLLPTESAEVQCTQESLEKNVLKMTGYLSSFEYTYPRTDEEFDKYCK